MDNKYIKIIKGTPLFHGMSDEAGANKACTCERTIL